jgi:hypothetical protein
MSWDLFAMDLTKADDIFLPFVSPQYIALEYRKIKSLVTCFKSYVLKL